MREITGDLFSHNQEGPSAICILTNHYINIQGANTMGRGCAAEAKYRWPGIQMTVGSAIRGGGNNCHLLTSTDRDRIYLPAVATERGSNTGWTARIVPYHIFTFPTKRHWGEKSDLNLIESSAHQLLVLTDRMDLQSVVLPRPGCGMGQLSWEDEVRPLISPILDDRFYAIDFVR